ncbi:hypothetical protein SAMN05444166_6194 [Singulisphaera sp. GP187]|uniref:hypothetical protein n=1 Tax=Singulisphaera sp. GP187 TaxID=1882752 RepID=UPI00092BC6E9|nr:hypothetical protein [Singulisphaera sp. GP187]SIO59875.1 hypothetical protein SAMN05444166_6194 [Singulisphaera sp. GP187]
MKMTHLLLAGAVAFALSDVGLAQDRSSTLPGEATAHRPGLFTTPDALPEPLPAAGDAGIGGGVLEALPKPADLPASLFAPPPPPSPLEGMLRVDAPYFVRDPRLDSPEFPSPGWFSGIELQVLKPHVLNGLSGTVRNRAQMANQTSTIVALPSAPLDWTVSPRVFLGYRLPSGFGEFLVAYRHLGTEGRGSGPGGQGASTLNSRLAFDMIDFDYNSRELSLGPDWDMKWTLGIRTLFMFFDSRFNQPFGQAAAGNGIFQARQYNNIAGAGPHAALDLVRHLGNSGWSLDFRTDFASVFDGSHIGFLTRSTTLGPDGRPLSGETRRFGTQDTPILNIRAGATWQPSRNSSTRFFLGYQYERFWALDSLPSTATTPPSVGQLWQQGIVLQATFNY